MRQFARIVLAAAAVACLPSFAQAKVRITVDLDAQTMHVESKDRTYDWKVSSGKSGYETPPGTYGVLWTDKDHLSDEYNKTPMPNAIFFRPGFAIHGATKSAFGRPASHGCVRLPVAKSAILFELVKAEGAEIKIVGGAPETLEARGDEAPKYSTAATRYRGDPNGWEEAPRYRSEAAPQEAPQGAAQPAPGFGGLFGGIF